MNYWMAEKANLSDCHEPLFESDRTDCLAWKKDGKEVYYLDGW